MKIEEKVLSILNEQIMQEQRPEWKEWKEGMEGRWNGMEGRKERKIVTCSNTAIYQQFQESMYFRRLREE